MDKKVLVAYASKYGSTKEIAERINAVLLQEGLRTDITPVDKVKDLEPYSAVVLGIAVYIGGWRKEAVKFLKVNEGALTEKSLWLFSSGPTGEGDPVELLEGWQMPKGQQTLIERIQPKDIVVFHGNVDVDKVNRLHKWMIKNVKAPIGDFRDWDAIVAWAESIATELNGVE